MEEKDTAILNIIIPEGTRNRLDISVGEDNLRLCSHLKCIKVRVVMTVQKFPGFEASSYPFIQFLSPSILVTPNQFEYLIKEFQETGTVDDEDLEDLPARQLNLKLDHSKHHDKIELMRLKSMINTYINTNDVIIFDYQEIKSKMDMSLQTMLLFLSLITGLLFIMSFFQLLLSIEGNIKDNQW